MTHDKNFNPTTKRTCAQVTRGHNEKSDMKNEDNKERMVVPQQNHNINGVNGETNEHNVHEAQTLADVICDFNETFKNEENSPTHGSQVMRKKSMKNSVMR